MNLLNKNGGKTSAPQRNIKEKLLEEQITSLRSIHQESFEAFDRIVGTLKKMINYKTEHSEEQRNQIDIQNTFIQNLGSIEQIFLSISEDLDADQELYKSTVVFRQADKNAENQTFKKIMKGYEDFKQNVNKRIHKLEKDIQLLETNGYHIYTQALTLPPNKVLCSLKKATLDKYLGLRGQVETVTQLIKNRLVNSSTENKQAHSNFVLKSKMHENVKMLKQISWKQNLQHELMIREINSIKGQYQREQTKLKMTEKAIKNIDQNIEKIEVGIKIMKEEAVNKEEVIDYILLLKENIEKHYILSTNLFERNKNRSKSCHSIMTRVADKKGAQAKSKQSFEQNSTILGCDFLEESIYI